MLKNSKFSLLSLLALTLVSLAFNFPKDVKGWVSHPEAKVQIWFPDNWEQSIEDGTLKVVSPDEELEIYAYLIEADELNEAMSDLDKELSKYVKDLKPNGEPTTIKLDEMDAMFMDGKGKVDGKDYDLGLILLATPTGKIMVLFAEGLPASVKKYEQDITKILMSIKKS